MERKMDISNDIYDIAVIGAGPAGAVFVKEIAASRPELKILLVDGQAQNTAKPCGGLLAPDAQKLLARFDLALPKSILEDPQGLVRYYQRHYLNMDRAAFDAWLVSLIPPHVSIKKARCREIKKSDGLYDLSLVQNGSLADNGEDCCWCRRRCFCCAAHLLLSNEGPVRCNTAMV